MTSDPVGSTETSGWWRTTAIAVVVAFALIGLALTPPGGRMLGWLGETLIPRPAVGGPFSLVDHTGVRRTEKDFAGRPVLLFFGFTHCPDVCPTTLASVSRWLAALGPDAGRITPLFVTVDPERDTVAVLADYLAAFDPRIVGLTGSQSEVAQMLRTYRAFARRTETGDFEHTAAVYLLDGQGALRSLIAFNRPDQEFMAALAKLVARDGA